MLLGEYRHNVDTKGRVSLPSKFRTDLGQYYVITTGLDDCLFVYSKKEWETFENKLKQLPLTSEDARTFTRFFLASATVCQFDKQGRINLVNSLIEYAELKKECAIIGVNDRLEIWALDKFNNLMNENFEKLDDISENLFDGDFDEA